MTHSTVHWHESRPYAMIRLKKNADQRVKKGHLWVFSNEIAEPPVSSLEPGSIHELVDSSGEFLAIVYANPVSLISARILSRKKVKIDGEFLHARIGKALEARKRLFPSRDFYRVVFGESDLLPGLIVDRYGSCLAVQTLTAGMDRLMDEIVNALGDVLSPEGMYLRNDSPVRSLEGLAQEKRLLHGTVPDKVELDSAGLKFLVDIPNGQKTGFFLDQESNRQLMKQYVWPGAKVLDLFAYTGAWGLHALAAGAAEVTAVDSSRSALKLAEENALLNGIHHRFGAMKHNVLDFLKKADATWDLIVLDPPAFIKSRSRIEEGRKGYIDINRRAIGRLAPGGILLTCSCSYHLHQNDFEEILFISSRQSGRQLRILDVRGQGPDHPVLLGMPETRYLKVVVAQPV